MKTRNTLIEEEIEKFEKEPLLQLADTKNEVLWVSKSEASDFLRFSLKRISDASIEAVRGEEKKWKYKKDHCCSVCDYLENSGENHYCECFNAALHASAEKEKNFTSK